MPHYNSYDSFQTKKGKDKKKRAKEKSMNKLEKYKDSFITNELYNFGIVIEVRYNDAYILFEDQVIVAGLRKDLNAVCNQVIFPGDKVTIEKNGDQYTITKLKSRISMLSRVKRDSTRLDSRIGITKNIAANIEIAVIVVAAKEPPLHSKFIDRYLLILQNSGIEAIICLNKEDLKTEREENILNIYRKNGISVIETSTVNMTGIETLKEMIKGKQAIFVGNSGVGKSSLTNAIMDGIEIKTSHVSTKSKRGRHTTTTSKYYVWNENSSIIDTPGIRSLDVSTFAPSEIQDYFSEFNDWKEKCKYKNCLHFNEPREFCLVKQGVEAGIISKIRYESYVRIMSNIIGEQH